MRKSGVSAEADDEGTFGFQDELGTGMCTCRGESMSSMTSLTSTELDDDELTSRVISMACGDPLCKSDGPDNESVIELLAVPSYDGREASACSRRLNLARSSQTARTYLGVAPRLINASGEMPSVIKFRIMSIYCAASSGLEPVLSARRRTKDDSVISSTHFLVEPDYQTTVSS